MNIDNVTDRLDKLVHAWELEADEIKEAVANSEKAVVNWSLLSKMAEHSGRAYLVGEVSSILSRIYDVEDEVNSEDLLAEYRDYLIRSMLTAKTSHSSNAASNLIDNEARDFKGEVIQILNGRAW